MVRGLYTAASGALVAQVAGGRDREQSCEREHAAVQAHAAPGAIGAGNGIVPAARTIRRQQSRRNCLDAGDLSGALGMGAQVMDTPAVFEQGVLSQTGNRWTSRYKATRFFAIQTPQGVRYTRDGQFSEDRGRAPRHDGRQIPCSGRNGASAAAARRRTRADRSRTVTILQNGRAVDTLSLVQFRNPASVRPEGDNRFIATNAALPTNGAAGSTVQSRVSGAQQRERRALDGRPASARSAGSKPIKK